MKAEINYDNKRKFFVQYWGQPIQTYKLSYSWRRSIPVEGMAHGYISLKPLSSITDEDAIEVARIEGYDPVSVIRNDDCVYTNMEPEYGVTPYLLISHKGFMEWDNDGVYEDRSTCGVSVSAYDFLRSRGYALPFMGLSVDTMVEAGWIKLITHPIK